MEPMRRSHRQLPVILRDDLEGIGFAGELVRVRAGFARNFLLAKGLAAVATPERIAEREKDIAKAEERRRKETAAREELAAALAETPVELQLKTGPGGQVFGSVTAAEFAKAVKEQRKLDVDPKQLGGLPLSALGPGQVSAKLGLGVTAQVPVVVKGVKAAKAPAKAKESEPDADTTEPATA